MTLNVTALPQNCFYIFHLDPCSICPELISIDCSVFIVHYERFLYLKNIISLKKLLDLIHVFHRQCIESYLKHAFSSQDSAEKKCPICRSGGCLNHWSVFERAINRYQLKRDGYLLYEDCVNGLEVNKFAEAFTAKKVQADEFADFYVLLSQNYPAEQLGSVLEEVLIALIEQNFPVAQWHKVFQSSSFLTRCDKSTISFFVRYFTPEIMQHSFYGESYLKIFIQTFKKCVLYAPTTLKNTKKSSLNLEELQKLSLIHI